MNNNKSYISEDVTSLYFPEENKQYSFVKEGWFKFSNPFKSKQNYVLTRSKFFGPLVKFCTAAVIIEGCFDYEEDPLLSRLNSEELDDICYRVFGSCSMFSDYDGYYDSIEDDVDYVLHMCNGRTINCLTRHPEWKKCISIGTTNAKQLMNMISRIQDWPWK